MPGDEEPEAMRREGFDGNALGFDGHEVVRFHGETGERLGVAASDPGLQGATHLSFDAAGALVVSWLISGRVVSHDPQTNTILRDVIDPAAANTVHAQTLQMLGFLILRSTPSSRQIPPLRPVKCIFLSNRK